MNHRLIHSIFLLALPVVVAVYGLSVPVVIALVLLLLLWRWLITLSSLFSRGKGPGLELETIAASHFVEKVRWCMDRLGVDYREKQYARVIRVLFKARSCGTDRALNKTPMTPAYCFSL